MNRIPCWHDGVLEEVTFFGPIGRRSAQLRLALRLYPSQDSYERKRFLFICSTVSTFEVSGDVESLSDNSRAGNVEDGVLHTAGSRKTLELRLVGGVIKVNAD